MQSSGITVVIPTYNNKHLLARTLESLCKQNLNKSQFEVIVVDDGSSDGTAATAAEYRDRINLLYFFQPDQGYRVAAARNIGINNAHFKTILFIDCGIVVSSRLLALHIERQKNRSDLVIIGTSYGVLDYSTRCADLINAVVKENIDAALEELSNKEETFDCRAEYLESIDYNLSKMKAPWLVLWGGHVSASTETLRSIGGFDEWFSHWGGEDNEIGIRLQQAGCTFEVLREVESIHLPHPKNSEQKRREARNNVLYLHKKHGLPESELLINHNWRCVISGTSMATSQTDCGCMYM